MAIKPCTLLGIKFVDFVDKEKNDRITGYCVYYVSPLGGEHDAGQSCDKVFFTPNKMDKQLYNWLADCTPLIPRYNRYGRVEEFVPA